MTTFNDVLGSAPRSWSTLKADLIRARRWYDRDDEDRQSRSFQSNQLDDARVQLLDSLLAHIQPAVDQEARFYELDQVDVRVKEERARWPG